MNDTGVAYWAAPTPWQRHLVKDGKTVLSVYANDGFFEVGLWRSSKENPNVTHFDSIYATPDPDELDYFLADVEPLPLEQRPTPPPRKNKSVLM